jgi:hypothetical protein
MATTRNQDLQASINHVTSEIGSTNSHLAQFEAQVEHKFDTMEANFTNQFNTLQSDVNQLLNRPSGPSSLDQHNVVEWLCTLGPILMDFKELTMQFQQEGKMYHFHSLMIGSSEIISSHRMENLLKKGHSGIISQLHFIHVIETPSVHLDL